MTRDAEAPDPRLLPPKVALPARAAALEAAWRPQVVARANGQELKLARLEGAFVWHRHEHEDEVFLGVDGRVRIELRDAHGAESSVTLGPGELVVVPRGLEHRPVADGVAHVLLFEPEGVRNTGDVEHPRFTAPPSGT